VITGVAVKCLGELLTNRIADEEPALIPVRTSSATTTNPHLARTTFDRV
jgi:hypothetical protein